MAERAEMQAFMDYQSKINDLLLQQTRQMQEFQSSMRQMLDESIRKNGNGKSNIVMKILFGTLMTVIVGIVGYYVQDNNEWKKTMRTDFNALQVQVYDNTATMKNSLTRIETILENRFPEARKK